MLTISTLSHITATTLPQPMQQYLHQRIATLHKNYCSDGLPPLEQFSLCDYGNILLAESYTEIADMTFESVSNITIDKGVYYLCAWVTNNETCCDVLIAQSLLTDSQRQNMENEIE